MTEAEGWMLAFVIQFVAWIVSMVAVAVLIWRRA
jgi:hypothetical protein